MSTQEAIDILHQWMDEALEVGDYQRYAYMHYQSLILSMQLTN